MSNCNGLLELRSCTIIFCSKGDITLHQTAAFLVFPNLLVLVVGTFFGFGGLGGEEDLF